MATSGQSKILVRVPPATAEAHVLFCSAAHCGSAVASDISIAHAAPWVLSVKFTGMVNCTEARAESPEVRLHVGEAAAPMAALPPVPPEPAVAVVLVFPSNTLLNRSSIVSSTLLAMDSMPTFWSWYTPRIAAAQVRMRRKEITLVRAVRHSRLR